MILKYYNKIYYLKMNGKNNAKNNTPPLRKKKELCMQN